MKRSKACRAEEGGGGRAVLDASLQLLGTRQPSEAASPASRQAGQMQDRAKCGLEIKAHCQMSSTTIKFVLLSLKKSCQILPQEVEEFLKST